MNKSFVPQSNILDHSSSQPVAVLLIAHQHTIKSCASGPCWARGGVCVCIFYIKPTWCGIINM